MLDHSRCSAQPTLWQGFGEDLLTCSSVHGSERFRGKNLGRRVCSDGLSADFGGRRGAEVPAPLAERHVHESAEGMMHAEIAMHLLLDS